MKQKKLFYIGTSIILFQFVVICVLAWQVWHRGDDPSENRHHHHPPVVETRKKSPSPFPAGLPQKENNMDMTDVDTIEDPIVVARAKYGKQLAKFMPFESKGKTDILKILSSFYPHGETTEILEKYGIAYDTAFPDFSKPEEKEQLILILLQTADDLWQMEESNEGKSPFADLPDLIRETEELLRASEASGDLEEAESLRGVIARLNDIQERNAYDPESEAEAEQRRREREYHESVYGKPDPKILALIKERGMPDSYSAYLELLKEEGLVPHNTPNLLTDPNPLTGVASPTDLSEESNPSPTEETVVSPSTPYDPVKSLSSAQTSLRSWRGSFEAEYFDVFISQSLTEQEIEQYFPTAQEREQLKSRTKEAQEGVVSKVRKLVNEIPNATQAQKSKLARELVNKNFDKDFADAVIEQLQFDEK